METVRWLATEVQHLWWYLAPAETWGDWLNSPSSVFEDCHRLHFHLATNTVVYRREMVNKGKRPHHGYNRVHEAPAGPYRQVNEGPQGVMNYKTRKVTPWMNTRPP